MESSAAKRRKISPSARVSVDDASATPSDAPEGAASKPKRPSSFTSPTKASLARHHPDILERKRASPRKPKAQGAALPSASRPNSRDGNDEEESRALRAQLERQSETGDEDGEGEERRVNLGSTRARSSQIAPQAMRPAEAPRSPTRKLGGGMTAPPQRTPNKPSPRPLPPPGPELDEDLLNPFLGRRLRRSTGVLPDIVAAEPELPPTPEHPDPVVSTPATGIHHSSTPSKRRTRGPGNSSSPLKQLSSRLKGHHAAAAPAANTDPKQVQPGVRSFNTLQTLASAATRSDSSKKRSRNAEKQKKRDELLAEVAKLEEDLELARAENDRIRLLGSSRGKTTVSENQGEVFDMLRRRVVPEDEKDDAPPSSQWLQAAQDPISFLPFGGTSSFPSLFQPKTDSSPEKPPLSHHPLLLSAEEELPYLQAFTSLSFTSQITILPPDPANPDSATIQRHIISVSSATPPGLFAARIEMSVNTDTQAILSLSVPRLEPAAVAELSPVVERVLARGGAGGGVLRNNVSALAWAMGEWLRLAVRRAKVWAALERELGTRDAMLESVARLRARRKRRRRRKGAPPAEDADDDDEEEELAELESTMFGMAELLPYLGKQSMDIHIPDLMAGGGDAADETRIRVNWSFEFDWTGEGRSRIGVLVGVPGKWRKADERGSLLGVPALFEKLVQEDKSPLHAVQTIVALLAGDSRA